MKQLVFGALFASLCPIAAVAAPTTNVPTRATSATSALGERTLVDRDALRSIEIVTDRRESVSQFFGRQKLIVGSWPTLDNKMVSNSAQWKSTKTRALFVSYPLSNDQGFKMDLFGANFQLLPPTPRVLSLLNGEVVAGKGDSLFILAPGTTTAGKTSARLVGRIQVFGAWSPSDELASLSYSAPTSSKGNS